MTTSWDSCGLFWLPPLLFVVFFTGWVFFWEAVLLTHHQSCQVVCEEIKPLGDFPPSLPGGGWSDLGEGSVNEVVFFKHKCMENGAVLAQSCNKNIVNSWERVFWKALPKQLKFCISSQFGQVTSESSNHPQRYPKIQSKSWWNSRCSFHFHHGPFIPLKISRKCWLSTGNPNSNRINGLILLKRGSMVATQTWLHRWINSTWTKLCAFFLVRKDVNTSIFGLDVVLALCSFGLQKSGGLV